MSFYTSLNGMKNAQTELNVISHNIANSETNGFKKSRVEFADIVAGTAYTNPKMIQGIGATVESISQNFTLGAMEQTGSALDIAINGDGFFETVNSSSGQTYYTRNGSFGMDGSGNVLDSSNNVLQMFASTGTGTFATSRSNATIPPTNTAGSQYTGVTVGANGDIVASYADGTNSTIGRIALASFIAPSGLKQVGSSNWVSTGLSGAAKFGSPGSGQYGETRSGMLERSNVDIAEELVSLITAQRNFQANAKAIDTATQISQTVINLRS